MLCPNCEFENADDAQACRRCRVPFKVHEESHGDFNDQMTIPPDEIPAENANSSGDLGEVCRRCETFNPPGARRCVSCGHALASESLPPAPTAAPPPLPKAPPAARRPAAPPASAPLPPEEGLDRTPPVAYPAHAFADDRDEITHTDPVLSAKVAPLAARSAGAASAKASPAAAPAARAAPKAAPSQAPRPAPVTSPGARIPAATAQPAAAANPKQAAAPALSAKLTPAVPYKASAPASQVTPSGPSLPPPPEAPPAPAVAVPAPPAEKSCASCNAVNPPAAKFCSECGTPFPKAAPVLAPPAKAPAQAPADAPPETTVEVPQPVLESEAELRPQEASTPAHAVFAEPLHEAEPVQALPAAVVAAEPAVEVQSPDATDPGLLADSGLAAAGEEAPAELFAEAAQEGEQEAEILQQEDGEASDGLVPPEQVETPPFEASLFVESGPQAGSVLLLDQMECTVGSEAQIALADDAYVAPRHLSLYFADQKLWLRDEGAVNGVYLRLRGPAQLHPGDRFIVGRRLLRFEGPVDLPTGEPTDPPLQGTPRQPAPLVRVVEVIAGGRTGRTCHRGGPVISIGKTGCEINFPSDETLAARHAELRLDDTGTVSLADVSGQGVFLRLPPQATVEVSGGDVFQVGEQLLRVATG